MTSYIIPNMTSKTSRIITYMPLYTIPYISSYMVVLYDLYDYIYDFTYDNFMTA